MSGRNGLSKPDVAGTRLVRWPARSSRFPRLPRRLGWWSGRVGEPLTLYFMLQTLLCILSVLDIRVSGRKVDRWPGGSINAAAFCKHL